MRVIRMALAVLVLLTSVLPAFADITNGAFETGDFTGWKADPNWTIMDNGSNWYSGWRGKYWAWSGGKGEAATGKLTSNTFRLDKDAVSMMISGWTSVRGTGKPRRWNYITLNLAENGKEIERVYAPDTTTFVPVILDCSEHRGKLVYIEAVDDADQETFSMLCIDEVKTVSLPAFYRQPVPALPEFDARKLVKVEDSRYRVEVSRATGSITRIHDKKGGLELIREPRLSESFKFTLPLPGKEPWQTIEANYIIGSQQKAPAIKVEKSRITITWRRPLVNYLGEKYDVGAVETIDLTPDGVLMNLRVDNGSKYQIGEIFFPMLGGITGIGKKIWQLKGTQFVRPLSSDATVSSEIFRVFTNMSWLGDQGPEQFYTYPKDFSEPWMELHAPKLGRSVYIGSHDPNHEKVLHLELKPGSARVMREDGNWPRPEELRGEPAGVIVSWVHFANSQAGTPYSAAPVLVQFHDGDWPEARKIHQRSKAK